MRASVALALLFPLCLLSTPANAQSQPKAATKATGFSQPAEREKANENLVMLLGGALGGPWIQLAQEMAIAVNEDDNVRVLPIAGEGSKQNLRDVLLVRGVDLGITRLEVLNEAKASGEFGPNLDKRVAYLAALSVDMLQLLAKQEISSLKDLDGKTVNVFPKGSVVPAVLKTMGVAIEEVNYTIPEAIQQMRAGKIDATACFCSVPVPAYSTLPPDSGFKLIDLPYVPALEESYLPASLTAETYPNLVAKGGKTQTIGSNVVLITYNWAPGTDRYRKIEAFVGSLFSNIDKLRQPPRHPSWRSVNLGGSIRGWARFPAAQQWLDRHEAEARKAAPASIDPVLARAQAARAAGGDAAEQERLFKEFLEWSRARGKR